MLNLHYILWGLETKREDLDRKIEYIKRRLALRRKRQQIMRQVQAKRWKRRKQR